MDKVFLIGLLILSLVVIFVIIFWIWSRGNAIKDKKCDDGILAWKKTEEDPDDEEEVQQKREKE